MFIRALATRDYAKAGDLCLMLTASLPNIDTEEVKEKLIQALRAWATRTLVRELPYHDKSLDNATIHVVMILVGYRCTMEWAWLRIHRALTTLDTSLIYLYSDVNYTRMLQRYFQAAERRRMKAMLGIEMVRRSLNAYAQGLDIQDRVNEYTLFQGTLVRRHAQVFRGATTKVAAVMALVRAVGQDRHRGRRGRSGSCSSSTSRIASRWRRGSGRSCPGGSTACRTWIARSGSSWRWSTCTWCG